MTNVYLEKVAELSRRDSSLGTGVQVAGGAALAGAALLTGKAFRSLGVAKKLGKAGDSLYARYQKSGIKGASSARAYKARDKILNRLTELSDKKNALHAKAEGQITNSLILGGLGSSAVGVGHSLKVNPSKNTAQSTP